MDKMDKKIELLAPAGSPQKLAAALYFGADAVYLSGKNFSLRAFSDNFDEDEIINAVQFVHSMGKKVYVAINIFAFNSDFDALADYARFLSEIGVDGVIVSDAGVFSAVKNAAPSLNIHISTQSNITNKHSAMFWARQGAQRIVLARELSLQQIKEIRDFLPPNVMLEAFVHGAMCMSYSGRCLLSNYLANRPSNRGECAQSCRWEYYLTEKSRPNEQMEIIEDNGGTYILNSKDLNMLAHIDKLANAGVQSFKIEGRVKTEYYVANTVNAYRRAIDSFNKNPSGYVADKMLINELDKASHRLYCTGFYLGENDTQCTQTSKPENGYIFCGVVQKRTDGGVIVEQRNRFRVGETLEVLSPNECFNKKIVVDYMADEAGNQVYDALKVQQSLFIRTDLPLHSGDILRKE